ncbi:Putative polyketide synthase [Beggiatoa sp. SS]|nr:Putative polyketide synthase [Beggiatoa sp. SS]
MIKDALVIKKTPDEIAAVLAPKVYGTLNLDEATQNEPLDFFVLFSSVTAVLGNVGQCDYAYANSFMDNFALWRSKQKRSGKTLSINWPLWQSGGMHVDEQTEKWLANTTGIKALNSEAGLEAFTKGLSSEYNPFIVIKGYRQKVRQILGLIEKPTQPITASTSKTVVQVDDGQLAAKLQQDLLKIASSRFRVP